MCHENSFTFTYLESFSFVVHLISMFHGCCWNTLFLILWCVVLAVVGWRAVVLCCADVLSWRVLYAQGLRAALAVVICCCAVVLSCCCVVMVSVLWVCVWYGVLLWRSIKTFLPSLTLSLFHLLCISVSQGCCWHTLRRRKGGLWWCSVKTGLSVVMHICWVLSEVAKMRKFVSFWPLHFLYRVISCILLLSSLLILCCLQNVPCRVHMQGSRNWWEYI